MPLNWLFSVRTLSILSMRSTRSLILISRTSDRPVGSRYFREHSGVNSPFFSQKFLSRIVFHLLLSDNSIITPSFVRTHEAEL